MLAVYRLGRLKTERGGNVILNRLPRHAGNASEAGGVKDLWPRPCTTIRKDVQLTLIPRRSLLFPLSSATPIPETLPFAQGDVGETVSLAAVT